MDMEANSHCYSSERLAFDHFDLLELLRSERELEQLRVLGALAFHTGTFMFLALDVDTEKALHSCNHVAY